MPSTIALLLCGVFVVILLRLERIDNQDATGASWLPAVWLILGVSKPLGYWISFGRTPVETGSDESGSFLDRTLLSCLIAIGLVILTRRGAKWSRLFANNKWLIAVHLLAFVSIIWSDFPLVSFKRFVRLFSLIIMGAIIASEPFPLRSLESVLRRTVYMLIPLSLVLVKYYPLLGCAYGRWSGERMWVGVTLQKNDLGVLCMLGAFLMIWRLVRALGQEGATRRWTWRLEVLVLLQTLILLKSEGRAFSATSVAALAIGLFTFAAFAWMRQKGVFPGPVIPGLVIASFFLYGVVVPFAGSAAAPSVVGALGRNSTFTDRTDIWRDLTPVAIDNAALGVGYGGFWVRPNSTGVKEAHNGYLDVWLENGCLGLALLLAFAVSFSKDCITSLREDFYQASFSFCFLLMTVIHNATESSILQVSAPLWVILVFLKVGTSSWVTIQESHVMNTDATRQNRDQWDPMSPQVIGSTASAQNEA